MSQTKIVEAVWSETDNCYKIYDSTYLDDPYNASLSAAKLSNEAVTVATDEAEAEQSIVALKEQYFGEWVTNVDCEMRWTGHKE